MPDCLLRHPMAIDKPEQLVDLLRLESGARVLEIALGKGEFIVQLAERYGVGGVGKEKPKSQCERRD